MPLPVSPEAIDYALREQSRWMIEARGSDRNAFDGWLEHDRHIFPDRRDMLLYLARHSGKIIPYKAMCANHGAPAEFLDHMLYGSGDILGQACRTGGKTMQSGIASAMDGYPFENRKHGLPVRILGGCLPLGEMVLTIDGMTAIQDVVAGETVFGRKGWKTVLKTTVRPYSGEIVKIAPSGSDGLRFTPNHKIWVTRDGQDCWVPAGEVQDTDLAVVPETAVESQHIEITVVRKHIKGVLVPDVHIDNGEDWSYLIGAYLAKGHCRRNAVVWQFHDEAARDKVQMLLKKHGLNPFLSYASSIGRAMQVVVYNMGFVTWMIQNCGRRSLDNQIPKMFMLGDHAALFAGLCVGDHDGFYVDSDYASTSLRLISQIAGILAWHGIQAETAYEQPRPNYPKRWVVRGVADFATILDTAGQTIRRSITVSKSRYTGTVFNLEVEDDPSYGTHSLLCHNSSDQSTRVYEEFQEFLFNGYHDEVLGDVTQHRTRFAHGGNVEILMASSTSVRGPHVPRLRLDEIDEFDEAIFNTALSIPTASEGRLSMVSMASTFHKPLGIMSRQLEQFVGEVVVWCIFEIMGRCDHECSTCNLCKYCPGWEKMKDAVGYVPVEELRAQRSRILDDEIYESEALCRRPRAQGLAFPTLTKKLHMNHRLSRDTGYPMYRVFDYGTDHPTVCGYWQIIRIEGRNQARCIDELRWRGKAPSVIVDQMLEHERKKGYTWFEGTYVPGDAAGFRAELENREIPTIYPDQSVENGIGTCRNLLVPDINGTVGLLLDNERCVETFKEMSGYQIKNGKPIKKFDDGVDMCRYFCHSRHELRVEKRAAACIYKGSLM